MKNKMFLSLCLIFVAGNISAYSTGKSFVSADKNLDEAIAKYKKGDANQAELCKYLEEFKRHDRKNYAMLAGKKLDRAGLDRALLECAVESRKPVIIERDDTVIDDTTFVEKDDTSVIIPPIVIPPRIDTPREATPRPGTPKVDTPREATPRPVTPREATPRPVTPRPVTPPVSPRKGDEPIVMNPLQDALVKANAGDTADLISYVNDAPDSELMAIKAEFDKPQNAEAKKNAPAAYDSLG